MTPDLEIRVTTEGGNRLAYVLRFAEGKGKKFDRRIEGPKLQSRPREYQLRVLKRLELLGKQLGPHNQKLGQAEVEQELAALGHDLYKELFPRELRAEYSQLRQQQEMIRSLLIVSDEPWIPWEIVKPYGTEGDRFDDDFLCCRFEMTRWLAKGGTLLPEIAAARIAAVEAAAPESSRRLRHAGEEIRFLEEIAGRREGVEFLAMRSATHPEIKELLEKGGNGVLLFVGHGEFDADDPDESRFLLDDGRALRPRDLHGPIEATLQQDRPLVFFNSCQVAQQGFSLTRIGGWAARWVRECGCGAFVGPQWSVDDALASLFSRTFFAALDGGATFGQAARAARQRVKEAEPGNPSWLAYTIYAHPNGRLRLGKRLQADSADLPSQSQPLDTGKLVVSRRRSPRRLLLARVTIVGLALLTLLAFGLYWRFGGDTQTVTGTSPQQDPPDSPPAPKEAVLQVPPYSQDAVHFHVVPATVDSALWRDWMEETADVELTAAGLRRTRSPNAAWLAVIELSKPTLNQGVTGRLCNVRASFEIYHERRRKGVVETIAERASQFTDDAACEAAIRKVAERVSKRVVTAYMDLTSED